MSKVRRLVGVILACIAGLIGAEEEAGCGCNMRRSEGQPVFALEPSSCSATSISAISASQMTFIEGGVGFIGTDTPIMRRDGEGPRRAVNLSSFYIDQFEVSNTGIVASLRPSIASTR